MAKFRKSIFLQVFLLLLVSISSYAEEDIEDLIDLAVSNDTVMAVIEGVNKVSANLLIKEEVLWSDSSGTLGAFLTDTRFFVVSTSSGNWQQLRLKIGEYKNAIANLSPYMTLLVTEDRAIGYSGSTNRFIETRIPLKEKVVAVEMDKYVAVVITTGRMFALSENSSYFTEARLHIKETVEEVKVTSNKVTVRTSDRLLSYVANESTWREYRLH